MPQCESRVVQLSIKVTPGLFDAIEKLAEQTRRTRNDIIHLLLELELERIRGDPQELAKL